MGIDPSMLLNVGLGLLQVGGKNLAGQGNLGTAMQGAIGNYYGQKEAQQKLQEGQLSMAHTKALLHVVGGLMGPAGDSDGAPQGAASPPPPPGIAATAGPSASPFQQPWMPPMGAAPSGPQAPPMAQPPQQSGQGPSWLNPMTHDQLAGSRVGGMDPRALQAYGILTNKNPIEAAKEVRDAQMQDAKESYAPAMGKLQTVIKSDSPTQYTSADPELKSAWATLAPKMGFDPDKDYNDQNVRTAFTFAHNGLASSVGAPTISPTVPKQHVAGRLGSVLEVDPVTGEQKQVVSPEALKDVIGDNGQPTNMRASQAEGRQPFNQSIFGTAALSDQAMELGYQQYKATGKMPAGFSKNPAMNAKLTDYIANRANQEGDTVTAAMARGQQLKATGEVVSDFEKGKTSQTLNGLNTAVKHMAVLDPLIDALGGGNLTILNKAQNFFKQQTGSAAPTNFAAIKEFVGGEVAKAVLPGGGGEAERKALLDPLNGANSPEQLHQAVTQIKAALAGKTEALRNQWDVGTRGTQGEFDKFLMPETKKALGIAETSNTPARPGQGAHPAEVQSLLDKYK